MLVATGASSSSIVDTVLMLSDTFLPASLTVIFTDDLSDVQGPPTLI